MLKTAKFSVDRMIDDIARKFLADEIANRIWLSADLRSLLMAIDCRHTEAENCVEYFFSGIVEAAGADRTILVSAFNFDFSQDKII